MRLDAGLGLVVLEFHGASGAVTSTIPSAQQIAAYRRWQEASLGGARAAAAEPPMPAASGSAIAAPPAAGRT
ncbi:MAG: hypothetical protein KGI51_02610 [Rhodospirillales bacterium]|nr:hypothetical protein [Rhodospirillales bacterium]